MELEVFKEIGFTDREVKIYLALLELGSSTVGPISDKSGLQRTKVYETLQKLMEKGLAHYIVISKTRHFEAANPKEILSMLDERKRKFTDILAELELKQRFANERQVAIVHDGVKAVKALFNRIADELDGRDFYYAFALKEVYRDASAPPILRTFHQRLAERKITDKVLVSMDVKRETRNAFKGNPNIQLRFIKRSTPMGCIIIPGKVIQLVWGERPTAVEITSAQIFEQYKRFFEELWAGASR